MTRFFLSAAFGLALALPASAQQNQRPRENDEVAKLRAEVRELEARLKKESEKKEEGERKGEKKPEQKGEQKVEGERQGEKKKGPKGPPMGGGFTGGGSGPMGGFGGQGFGRNPFAGNPGPMPGGPGGEGGRGGSSGMSGGPDFTRMPGFYRLSQEEQKTLAALMQKLRTPPPERSGDAPMGGGGVEARLDRLEKAIEELKGMMRGPTPGGPGRPPGGSGGRGAGAGGPPGGAPGDR